MISSLLITSILFISSTSFAIETHWFAGGVIGAGIGVAAGAGAGYAGCGSSDENTSRCRQTMMPVVSILSGAVGFGLGALIGSAVIKGDIVDLDNDPAVMPTVHIDPENNTYGIGAMINF